MDDDPEVVRKRIKGWKLTDCGEKKAVPDP